MSKIIIKLKNEIFKIQSRFSIAKRIFVLCTILVIIPVIILVITANTLSQNIVARKSIHTSIQNLDLITQSMNGLLNHVEDLSKIIISNDRIQEHLRQTETTESQRAFEDQFIIRSMLDNIVGQGVSIDSIVIYSSSGSTVHTGNISIAQHDVNSFLNSDLFESIKDRWGGTVWIDTHNASHQNTLGNEYGISMYRAIVDINTGNTMGAIEINISKHTLRGLYDHIDYGRQGSFLIMNRNGKVISDSINTHYSSISPDDYYAYVTGHDKMGRIIQHENKDLLITSSSFPRLEWYMIGFLPANELKEDNAYIQISLFLIGLFFIGYGIITSKFISKLIAKPIVDLAQSMDRVGQGILDTRVTVKSDDEVGVLARSFNSMAEQITDLMNQIYSDQSKMRELELMALQAQIKPHFLYNTLESVASLSRLGRMNDVFDMVKTLSMFYRTSLSAGKNAIPLEKELEITRYYLGIQQMRYQDKLTYRFRIDGTIIHSELPKLVIQPLVENAIYHGIKNKRIKGQIIIIVRKTGSRNIVISVVDNGSGMRPDKLLDLNAALSNPENNQTFGLKNINERIKKYFGSDFGIQISSKYGYWTKTHLIIPMTISPNKLNGGLHHD